MNFFLTYSPSAGLARKITPRNLGNDFGDGYSEIVPDGLNTMLMDLDPQWTLLSFEEADRMDAFLRTQAGQTFVWQHPRETTPRAWRCPEWSMTDQQTTSDITAKFKEQPSTAESVNMGLALADAIETGPDYGIVTPGDISDYTNRGVTLRFTQSKYRIDTSFSTAAHTMTDVVFVRSGAGTALTTTGGVTNFALNVPRTTDRGHLVEGSRTNLILRSQEFDNASWAKTASSVVANAEVAPDGTLTADTLIEDITNNQHRLSQAATVVSGSIYTYSVFAKANTRSGIYLRIITATTVAGAAFNLQNGTVNSTFSGSAQITALTNGWYLCSVTGVTDNATATCYANLQYAASDTGIGTYVGDGSSGIYVWGAQLEVGSVATSYIPTTTASATAALDVMTLTRALSATEDFTLHGEIDFPLTAYSVQTVFDMHDGTNNTGIYLQRTIAGTLYPTLRANGLVLTGFAGNSKPGARIVKWAFSRAGNVYKFYVDGYLIDSQTVAGALPLTTVQQGGLRSGSFPANAYIREYVHIGKVLSDAEAIAVTTPAGGLIAAESAAVAATSLMARAVPYGIVTLGHAVTFTNTGWELLFSENYYRNAITTFASLAATTGGAFSRSGVGTAMNNGRNLLLRSQEFDNAGTWTASRVTISGNVALAPDGSMTADLITEDTASGTHRVYQQVTKAASSVQYTATVYIKASGRTFAQIRIAGTGETLSASVPVNLTTGIVGAPYATGVGWTSIAATSEVVGNGWVRVCLTGTSDPSTTVTMFVMPALDLTSATPSYAGAGTAALLVWGAQLETSPFANAYFATGATADTSSVVNFATGAERRVDHGLLIEDARTNLLLYSQTMSNGVWQTFGGASKVGVSPVVAPDGSSSAYEASFGATGGAIGAASAIFQTGVTVASATSYVFSIWVRAKTGSTTVRLSLDTGGTLSGSADTTVTSSEWTRISVSLATTATTATLALRNNTAGNTTNVYFWGAQLEIGTIATSYIPTTTAAVTRALDVPTMTQAIGPTTDFTIFGEVEFGSDIFVTKTILDAHDGTDNTGIYLQRNPAGVLYPVLRMGGLYLTGFPGATKPGARTVRFVIMRSGILYSFYADGYLVGSVTVTGLTALTTLHLGQLRAGTAPLNSYLRKLTHFPLALVAEEARAMTQLPTGLIVSEASPVSAVTLVPRPAIYGMTTLTQAVAFQNTGHELLFQEPYYRNALTTSVSLAALTGGAFARASAGTADYRGRNLFSYSDQFGHANWTKSQLTVSANQVSAPDGSVTADKLVSGNLTGGMVIYQSTALTANQPVTVSAYFKAISGEVQWVYIRSSVNGAEIVSFDLTSGVVGGVQVPWSGARIESVGNGWYRCSAVYTSPATLSGQLRFGIQDVNQGASFTGNGVKGVYIWGAQAEYGSNVTNYTATAATVSGSGQSSFASGAARVTDRGLLVEEARTNKITGYNANPILAPTPGFSGGTCTCTLVDDTAALAAAGLSSICTSGQVYKVTFSGTSYWLIAFDGNSGNTNPHVASAYIRSMTATPVSVGYDNSEAGILYATTTAYQRFQSLPIPPSATNRRIMISGGGTGDMYVILPQFEEGHAMTSPIVVAGAAATRALDVPTMATSLASNQDFTLFGEVDFDRHSLTEQTIFELHDGTSNNTISIRRNWNGVIYPIFTIDGVVQTGFSGATRGGSRRTRWCLIRSGTSYSFYSDGYLIETRTIASVPAMTTVHHGQLRDGTLPLNGFIRRYAMMLSAISGAEAIAMTTPQTGLVATEATAALASVALVRPALNVINDAAQAAGFMNTGQEYVLASDTFYRRGLVTSTTLAGLTGVTFSRASTGTSVAKSRNMFAYSQDFSNSAWTKTNNSGTVTATTNAMSAPDGSMSGARIVEGVDTGYHGVSNASFITVGNVTMTASFYVKAAERTRCSIRSTDLTTGGSFAYFDLTTGTVTSIDNAGKGSWSNMTAGIQNVGGGWYRIWATQTKAAGTQVAWGCQMGATAGVASYLGVSGQGMYIWGAQLEVGDMPQKYRATLAADPIAVSSFASGAPRVTSRGLEVEDPATNLLLRSEEFDNASWLKNAAPTVTANATTAPDGTSTADTIATTTASQGPFQIVTVTSGQVYTWSVHVKLISGSGTLRLGNESTPSGLLTFNLTTGAITSPEAGVISSGVEVLGNGWYRVSGTYISTDTSDTFVIYAGDATTKTFALWGAQLELGTRATSYVPTTTATATRPLDVLSNTVTVGSTSDFTLYGEDDFADASYLSDQTLADLHAGSATDGLHIARNSFGVIYPVFRNGGALLNGYAGAYKPGARRIRWTFVRTGSTTYKFFVDGYLISTTSHGAAPSLTTLRTGSRFDGSNALNGVARNRVYMPHSMSDADAIALTTPGGGLVAAESTPVTAPVALIRPARYGVTSTSEAASFMNTGVEFDFCGSYFRYGALTSTVLTSLTGVVYTRNSVGTAHTKSRNLLFRSAEFDNATYWNVTNTTVTANSVYAPNGLLAGDTLNDGVATGIHSLFQVFSVTSGVRYAFSVYLKDGGRRYAQLFFGSAGHATTSYANFDLQAGTITATGATASAYIEDAGNGWYRCTLSAPATATTASGSGQIACINSSGAARGLSYTGTSASIYMWAAQAEEGRKANAYFATTTAADTGPVVVKFSANVPRITSLGYLAEEARTNLLLRSEEFDNASWSKLNLTVTADATTAPDGTTTADKIEAASSTFVSCNQSVVVSSTGTHVASVYAKKGSGATDANVFVVRNGTTATNLLVFTLNYDTGAISYSVGSSGVSVEAMANGWWRVTAITPVSITAGDTMVIYCGFSGNAETAGEFAYLWGAQLEFAANGYASSYIPTTSASATRPVDLLYLPITVASTGTLLARSLGNPLSGTRALMGINASGTYTAPSGFLLRHNSTVYVEAGGNSSALQKTLSTAFNGRQVISGATYGASSAMSVTGDGLTVATGTSDFTAVGSNRLQVGGLNSSGTQAYNGYIQSIAYLPFALSNGVLEAQTL